MGDPLAGQRQAINDGEVDSLLWPDTGQGQPVQKGELFVLRSCQIEISKVHRVTKQGQWMWRAEFVRHFPDKVLTLARRGDVTEDEKATVRTNEHHGSTTICSTEPMENPLNLGRPPEPEPVPSREVPTLTKSRESRREYEQQQTRARLELDAMPLSERVRVLELLQDAGHDVGRELAAIRNRVQVGERKAGLRRVA